MASPITFLQQVRSELNKVVWPTKDQVVKLTGMVVAISVAVGLFLGGVDFIFVKIMEILL